MWEINNTLQIQTFQRAVVFGFLICIAYDILRSFKIVFKPSDFTVFLTDFLFCVILAPFVFCFFLATTNGELRGYVAFGILTGFFVIRLSVSRLLHKALCFLLSKLVFVLNSINRLLLRLFSFMNRNFTKYFKKALILGKKIINSFKKLLKKR